jgi:hypothetical protein
MTGAEIECPPVLLIIFKRPETTRHVMAAIRRARPSRLYIAADGPREGRAGEFDACQQARIVATTVDWPCEVKTLFQETNLGCRLGECAAFDWFFENEPEGILLEDDTVPNQSFFSFCAELLLKYRFDTRVSMIGGTNFQQGVKRGDASYYFSRMHHCWGWASWRRAWDNYDRDMSLWSEFKRNRGFAALGLNGLFKRYYTPSFDAVAEGRIDTYDYQWAFTALVNNTLSIIPQVNLVSNIGFGTDATHTFDQESSLAKMQKNDIDFPLIHPTTFVPRLDADLASIKPLYTPLHRRIVYSILRRVKVAQRKSSI